MASIVILLLVVLLGLLSGVLLWFSSQLVNMNHYQLKSRAKNGDEKTRLMYSIHMRQNEVLLILGVLNALTVVLFVLILASFISLFGTMLLAVVGLFFVWQLLPSFLPVVWFEPVFRRIARFLAKIMQLVSPVTRPLARFVSTHRQSPHQYLYTKEQLLDVLGQDKLRGDSDVTADELKMLRNTLLYGDRLVREVMTPRRMVRTVSINDQVGPILMHELHETGFSRFPVTGDDTTMQFVGTLYLRDLVDIADDRTVKQVMKKDVYYMHEEQQLDYALRAFLKTKHHLFVVVNSFEEFVGVLTLEDIIEEVLGREIVDEFDSHDDLRTVARSLAEKEAKERQEKTA